MDNKMTFEESCHLGLSLNALVEDHTKWSQETFGSDSVRGPIGPLKHLAKEAKETQEDPGNIVEYADCLLIFLDALRRAGFDIKKVIHAAIDKMEVNKTRTWPKTGLEDPVEHKRDD